MSNIEQKVQELTYPRSLNFHGNGESSNLYLSPLTQGYMLYSLWQP